MYHFFSLHANIFDEKYSQIQSCGNFVQKSFPSDTSVVLTAHKAPMSPKCSFGRDT